MVLGVVEGITEFLPVSSTGHLILTSRILGLPSTEFLKSFDIAIQSGAIGAVVVLYGRILLRDREMLKRVMAAFLPTAVIGALFYKLIKGFLLGSTLVVAAALFIGGILIVVFEKFHSPKEPSTPAQGPSVTYTQALLIGLFQSLAMIPGVSRAAATILGGLWLGIKRKTIVEFSFILAVPTMLAATGYDLWKTRAVFSWDEMTLLAIGFVVSFIVAVLSIKFLLHFIKKHSFEAFGYYRILAAVLFFVVYH